MKHGIDINCDMGEGLNNDAAIMPYILSANVACGYHAGNEDTLKTVLQLALQHGVRTGAHVSYNDRENFGRKEWQLSEQEIYQLVQEQLRIFKTMADITSSKMTHVKPHGALYNQSAKDITLAATIAQAVKDFDVSCILVGLSGSVSISEAEKIGLKTFSEVFADRTYQPNGTLTPRSNQHALVHTVADVVAQTKEIIQTGKIRTLTGAHVAVKADTICIHGDGEHAEVFAKAVYETVKEN
jgi:5-oxoprolinase (ATP-hydrolysing) subunit A